jgi:Zn-dependent peptidase ImmA (M78 family)
MRRTASLLLLVILVASSCGDGSPDVAGLENELDALVAATEDVRGLTFFEDPEIIIVSSGELADRVRLQLEEDLDPEETLITQRLFETLGLLDGSVDLLQSYTDLYAEAVGGFYDNETGEMVISGDDALSPLAKTIVVHELIHALTDQHFDFASKLDLLIDEKRYQEASAIQALAEGDATYFQLVYMQTLPTSEQVEAVQESLSVDTTVSDSLPEWFSEDLTWPYDAGFGFVDRLVSDLGVSGLNQTYTLLPTTSEHIIHPGSYLTRQPPRPASLPDVVIEGYEVFEESQWGEWNLQLYLLDGVDPGEAIVAATGWGGDEYRIYWDGTDVAFAYLFVGDTPRDADEMATSLAESVRQRMAVGSGFSTATGTTFSPGADFALIVRDGATVLFVAAGDPLVGANLGSQLRAALTAG